LWLLLLGCVGAAQGAVVYATGFEVAEGYDSVYTLDGQQGWVADGTGGNGVYANLFGLPEFGQQAYVGLFPPLNARETSLFVWQPINLAPIPPETPVVRFSVRLMFFDSVEVAEYDWFRWSVFNTNGTRLLTVDFDTWDYTINYRLQNSNDFTPTGRTFDFETLYQLQVLMDFSRNLWSASLSDTLLITNQPITTDQSPLHLGDIPAVWVYANPDQPGDNYMVFDDYRITREPASGPRLFPGERVGNNFLLRLLGEPGRRYALDATTNFTAWTALRTNTADLADGYCDFIDSHARTPRRFYRGRLVP
jgi:hypothetical protein